MEQLKQFFIRAIVKKLAIPIAIFISILLSIVVITTTIPGLNITETASASSAYDIEVSDGDYIVDTTKSEPELVITDKKTLTKAFKDGYSTNQKLLDNVDTFLEMQEKYNVNAIFAAAVSIKETTAGTKGHALCCHNWFNYQPLDDMKKGDSRWAYWDNESDCIMGFGKLIATSQNYYFSNNEYTVSAIGDHYCPPGDGWASEVKDFMKQLYAAVDIHITSKSVSSSNSEETAVEGDGYDKTYTVNGATYKEFKQSRGSYKDDKYSSGTIASSGCGPTSAAIVASGYGINHNPGTLVKAAKNKYNVSNFVASPDATSKMLKTAGLEFTSTYSLTKSQLTSHLLSEKPVVMSVDSSCGAMFTGATHYIAILDIKDDKVYVSNPNPSKATGWIDIDKVIECNKSSSRVALLITTTNNNKIGSNKGSSNSDEKSDSNSSKKADKVIEIARKQLGKDYVYGATGPNTFDCSGLVLYCCKQAEVKNLPPRSTSSYSSSFSKYKISLKDKQPGDILWKDGHVGIYIGNNKFIHAPHTGDVVKIESLKNYTSFTDAFRPWK